MLATHQHEWLTVNFVRNWNPRCLCVLLGRKGKRRAWMMRNAELTLVGRGGGCPATNRSPAAPIGWITGRASATAGVAMPGLVAEASRGWVHKHNNPECTRWWDWEGSDLGGRWHGSERDASGRKTKSARGSDAGNRRRRACCRRRRRLESWAFSAVLRSAPRFLRPLLGRTVRTSGPERQCFVQFIILLVSRWYFIILLFSFFFRTNNTLIF